MGFIKNSLLSAASVAVLYMIYEIFAYNASGMAFWEFVRSLLIFGFIIFVVVFAVTLTFLSISNAFVKKGTK